MWMGCQRHASAALSPEWIRFALCRRLGGPPGPVWTVAENLAPTGIRSPDGPARSESLYRLSYRFPRKNTVQFLNHKLLVLRNDYTLLWENKNFCSVYFYCPINIINIINIIMLIDILLTVHHSIDLFQLPT